ncbi:CpsD/CapB family tyrosine-protein kinase [Thermogemmatispora carboxidivorans]|uniref:CpsD/CapB family tyrosine-protein kinase n=1 Tax=Thermogemmatispora carboxidivorans TaxID=1382306 RepID=UPI00069B4FD0|nr:CpsD/CapB family tyrosine-protein kinase [Thermogemmatispora carboxidivorans]
MAEHDRLNKNKTKQNTSAHDSDSDTVKLPALRSQPTAAALASSTSTPTEEQVLDNPDEPGLALKETKETRTQSEALSKVKVPETPVPGRPGKTKPEQPETAAKSQKTRELLNAQALRERCRQLCAATFFRERSTIRSLGFTSATAGEGKTLLALATATVLANDSGRPVTLLECTWERPCLQELFNLPRRQGLAEWLRGECSEEAIRYQVSPELTVIPAGNAAGQAMKLIHLLAERQLLSRLPTSQELFILDLPPLVTSGYGALAASLADSLILVVHAGVTSEVLVSEACAQLRDLPVQGILLNQIESSIPRWIRQLL